jgi:hypothetical protein
MSAAELVMGRGQLRDAVGHISTELGGIGGAMQIWSIPLISPR